nr:hypothetical protein [Propionibacterium sp.]
MLLAETSPFDTVAGLPVHPLVVHAAVVLLPLAALLLVALIAVRRWRAALGVPTLLALAGGTAAAFVAAESGEALAARVGVPGEHERWGSLTPGFAAALLVVAAGWYLLQRRDARAAGPATLPTRVGAGLVVLLAVTVTGLTVLAGHSGAVAVWGARLA